MARRLNRRSFLKRSGLATTAGITFGIGAGGCSDSTDEDRSDWQAWLRIRADGLVTVSCPHVELGQGIHDSFALIVARELDLPFDKIEVAAAPLDRQFGRQRTENSDSIRTRWDQLQKLCSDAKVTLVELAAEAWNVGPGECSVSSGSVIHASSGRRFSFAKLVSQFGDKKSSENAPGSNHTVEFTADVRLPGMLFAALATAPYSGARVASFDRQAILAEPGVLNIVDLGDAVAIVAESSWQAMQAAKQRVVSWIEPEELPPDSRDVRTRLAAACDGPGGVAIERGDPEALSRAEPADRASGDYFLPFDSHNMMEPAACVADVREHSVEVWAPTQDPWQTYYVARDNGLSSTDRFRERANLKLTDVAGSRVKVNPVKTGGAFGGRLKQDHVRQAVLVSKAVGKPIQLQWTREQEIHYDYFRATSGHRIQAAVSPDGRISSWHHRIAGCGIIDHGIGFPYDCDNVRVELSQHDFGVSTGSMRSTSHSPNAFARECFIDNLANRSQVDPVAFRLSMLAKSPRLRNVLQAVADAVDWENRFDPGIGLGVALHPSKGSYVAQIAEVKLVGNNIVVERITCAVDCGRIANPDAVDAQISGGIIFGLSSALKSQITIENGRIQQSNFHDLPIITMDEAPEIDIVLVDSRGNPGGVGEISLPPVAPAVANAIYSLTGVRQTSLPLTLTFP